VDVLSELLKMSEAELSELGAEFAKKDKDKVEALVSGIFSELDRDTANGIVLNDLDISDIGTELAKTDPETAYSLLCDIYDSLDWRHIKSFLDDRDLMEADECNSRWE